MKRILYYLSLAALAATSGYTLPMHQMMGGLDFSTIAGTCRQSFGKYALAATAGAALYVAHACTSPAQKPTLLHDKDLPEIGNIRKQLYDGCVKTCEIGCLKVIKRFNFTPKEDHVNWYKDYPLGPQVPTYPDVFVIKEQEAPHGRTSNNFKYILSLPEAVRDTCLQLIEDSNTLTKQQIQQCINTNREVLSKHYSEPLKTAIVDEIERLRLATTAESIKALTQKLSAAQKKLSEENAARLNQYYDNQYKYPCLTGAIMGIATRAAYPRYPRATVAFLAITVMATAYYNSTINAIKNLSFIA